MQTETGGIKKRMPPWHAIPIPDLVDPKIGAHFHMRLFGDGKPVVQIERRTRGKRAVQGRPTTILKRKNGVSQVSLGQRVWRLANVVAWTFVGPPPQPGWTAWPRNGDHSDFRPENLEWISSGIAKAKSAVASGKVKPKAVKAPTRKVAMKTRKYLTEIERCEIWDAFHRPKRARTAQQLAAKYDVHTGTIYDTVKKDRPVPVGQVASERKLTRRFKKAAAETVSVAGSLIQHADALEESWLGVENALAAFLGCPAAEALAEKVSLMNGAMNAFLPWVGPH